MMKKIEFIFFLLVILCIPKCSAAQDLKQSLPVSKAVRQGMLKNGMTYYICKTPKHEKASFYVIQPTGSLVEQEGEYGLAHFVEHLVFSGTRNYKNREIIDLTRKLGLQFGPDLNAGTGFEMTLYKFENVPLWNEQVSTDCLLMLRDMMYEAELNDSDIEKERNVIIEERLFRQESNAELAGTPFSRPIIGDTTTILHCSPQTVRDFYHRWYQPQMQAVVAIGPFDVEQMYEKVRSIFEPVPAGTSAIPARIVIPPFTKPRVFVRSLDESDVRTSINFTIRQNMLANSNKNTIESVLPGSAVLSLSNPIVETFKRLYGEDICCYPSYKKDIDNVPVLHFSIWSDKYGPKELLSRSIKTIRSVADFGFPRKISDEYLANYADTLKMTDSQLWESNDTVAASFFRIFENCLSNFLYGTPIIDHDVHVKMGRYLDNSCGMQGYVEQFRQLFYAACPTLSFTVPKQYEITEDELQEVIADAYQTNVEPIRFPSEEVNVEVDRVFQTGNIDAVPGKMVNEKLSKDGKVWRIKLSNGVTVLMHQIDSVERKRMKNDFGGVCTSLYAYREGGKSKLNTLQYEGVSCMSRYTMATGSIFSVYDHYDEAKMEYIYHNDIEEKFKMFYHELTNSEISAEDSIHLAKQWKEDYNLLNNAANKQFRKILFPPTTDSNYLMHDSTITAGDYRAIHEAWKTYKSNYNGMVVAIDHVDKKDSIMPLVLKYIGGLPSKNEPSVYRERWNSVKRDSVLTEPSSDPNQDYFSMILFQEKGFSFTAENYLLHKALESALLTAVVNRIRLQNGDVYTPYVSASIELLPVAQQVYRIVLSFARGMGGKVEHEVKQLLQDMAYGDGITQQMIDDYIKSVYASGGIYPHGGAACQELQKIKDKGVVVDTRTMKLEKVITLKKVRNYLHSLLKYGHYYEYKNISLK